MVTAVYNSLATNRHSTSSLFVSVSRRSWTTTHSFTANPCTSTHELASTWSHQQQRRKWHSLVV